MDTTLNTISENKFFTPYHLRAWQSTYLLEKAGLMEPERAKLIRERHLTVGFDANTGSLVDLLTKHVPRPFVVKSNKEQLRITAELKDRVASGVDWAKTLELRKNLFGLPIIKRIVKAVGSPEMNNVNLFVYGHDSSDHTDGSPSLLYYGNNQINIAVPPNLYGLGYRFVDLRSNAIVLGYRDFDDAILWPLIAAIYEIVSGEVHDEYDYVTIVLKKLLKRHGNDIDTLAGEFVLGNPEPLYEAIDSVATPLGTALLIFVANGERQLATVDRAITWTTLEKLSRMHL